MRTVREALENALTLLESLGFKGGDMHDDLAQAIGILRVRAHKAMKAELPERPE